MTGEIIALAVLVLLSAFFSGLEIALFSLGRAQVHSLVEKRKHGALVVERLKANPERLLVTILIGNNIVNIGAAAMATALALRVFGDVGVGIATGVMTFLILVFGEITPKTFAYRWAEKYALIFARPLEIFGWLIFPIVWCLEKLTKGLTKAAGSDVRSAIEHKSLLSSLARMALEEGKLKESEHRAVLSALQLDRIPASRVMTPRRDIYAIEAKTKLVEAMSLLAKSPYTRYPVFQDKLDEVVGVLHIRDLYERIRTGSAARSVNEIAGKPTFIPRTMVIGDLLKLFQHERAHMAIVIGEYGETVGLVTLEDVLEELVGEIEDETDDVRRLVRNLGEKCWMVNASIPIEDLERATGIRLPAEQHNTINGLLLDRFQGIPKAGDRIEIDGYVFVIRQADAKRVILTELSVETGETVDKNSK